MTDSHTILHIPFNELTDVDALFQEYSHIDMSNIPIRYGNKVFEAKQLIEEHLQISAIYKTFPISHIEDDLVTLKIGASFSGSLLPKVLKDSKELICYIITLTNYNNLLETVTNKLLNYFLDTWSSAFIESATNYFKHHIDQTLSTTNLKRTYLWSPGFQEFNLENQQALFNILDSNAIGCTLNNYFHMNPSKSTSGVMGIISKAINLDLKPCNFCSFNGKCSTLQEHYCC